MRWALAVGISKDQEPPSGDVPLAITGSNGQEVASAFWPGEPITDQSREFTMVSLWDGLDSLRQAVGHDWKQAVLSGDEADLVEQVAVDHYETFGI